MATGELQVILQQAEKLSAVERVEIIKRLADTLMVQSVPQKESQFLEYGKYQDFPGKPVDDEDFKSAEWHPTDEELNG